MVEKKPLTLEVFRAKLQAIAQDLDSGKIMHVARGSSCELPEGVQGFNMYEWSCGSVHCIGGTLELRLREAGYEGGIDPLGVSAGLLDINLNESEWAGLEHLFYPGGMSNSGYVGGYEATPAQAAQAIRNYLEHNRPMWREVMDAAEA